MTSYSRTSTSSCSASSRDMRSGRTLKPMIVAFEAMASWTSNWVIPPTRPGGGHRAGHLVVGGDPEVVTGGRDLVEAEHDDRGRRARLLHAVAVVVEQRPYAPPRRAGHDRVADPERAP